MSGGPRVFIDANVFVTVWTIDVMLTLAEGGLVDPRWSDMVMREAEEAIRRVKGGNPARYLAAIESAFPLAEVVVEGIDLPGVKLPDPDDLHVVSGALEAECATIVTYNLKDFPTESLRPLGVRAVHPDEFLMTVARANPVETYAAVCLLVAGKEHPPRSMEEEIEGLRRNRLFGFADFLEGRAGR